MLYRTILIFLIIFLNSCQISDSNDDARISNNCIVGTYYNHHTKDAMSYIQLRGDSTFTHFCKYKNLNYLDSGKWTYRYNDGQNDIRFYDLELLRIEGGDNNNKRDVTIGMPLVNCGCLFLSDFDETLNFYKK